MFWCGQASFFLVLALYLQQGRGLSALNSGLVFTILAAAYVSASARAPGLTARHGRRLLGAGALVLAAGHGLLLAAVADIGIGRSIAQLVPGLSLATMQNLGGALGVAITGAIFFGALHGGYAHAFELCLAQLAVLLLGVALLSRLLPARERAA